MNSRYQRGFTVIELMLFLSITGALFAGLMVGVNTSIYQQRYRESVTSYSTLLQNQYNEVANTRNDRGSEWRCADSVAEQTEVDAGEARGTTSCVILGRYVQPSANGSTINTGMIIGTQPADATGLASDQAVLQAYNPKKSLSGEAAHEIDWQSSLKAVDGTPYTASIIILRSPLTGLVRTYVYPTALPGDLATVMSESSAQTITKACIAPPDITSATIQSVELNAAIASASGVTVNGYDEECQ